LTIIAESVTLVAQGTSQANTANINPDSHHEALDLLGLEDTIGLWIKESAGSSIMPNTVHGGIRNGVLSAFRTIFWMKYMTETEKNIYYSTESVRRPALPTWRCKVYVAILRIILRAKYLAHYY
jgi:hypothetical protein